DVLKPLLAFLRGHDDIADALLGLDSLRVSRLNKCKAKNTRARQCTLEKRLHGHSPCGLFFGYACRLDSYSLGDFDHLRKSTNDVDETVMSNRSSRRGTRTNEFRVAHAATPSRQTPLAFKTDALILQPDSDRRSSGGSRAG